MNGRAKGSEMEKMNQSSEGQPPAKLAATVEPAPEEPSSVRRRTGLFGRLIDALSPSALVLADTDADTAVATPPPGISNLRKMRVDDVSIPKADIVAVPATISLDELIEVFRDCGLTRLPVFDGTLDTPVGLINLKDCALRHGFSSRSKKFDLASMLRPLLFVPPSMPVGVLLQKMQAERIHMALIVDEYGGTDALVTLEDLIETVVGEIEDEHDVDEADSFSQESPGVWVAQAKTQLDEFEAAIGKSLTEHRDIDAEEVDTLGGLIFMLAGHVPARGEVIRHPDGPEFEIIDADPRRIKRLRVRLSPAQKS